jgi:hypothetical protein
MSMGSILISLRAGTSAAPSGGVVVELKLVVSAARPTRFHRSDRPAGRMLRRKRSNAGHPRTQGRGFSSKKSSGFVRRRGVRDLVPFGSSHRGRKVEDEAAPQLARRRRRTRSLPRQQTWQDACLPRDLEGRTRRRGSARASPCPLLGERSLFRKRSASAAIVRLGFAPTWPRHDRFRPRDVEARVVEDLAADGSTSLRRVPPERAASRRDFARSMTAFRRQRCVVESPNAMLSVRSRPPFAQHLEVRGRSTERKDHAPRRPSGPRGSRRPCGSSRSHGPRMTIDPAMSRGSPRS